MQMLLKLINPSEASNLTLDWLHTDLLLAFC